MSARLNPAPQTQEDAYALITREIYFTRDSVPDFEYAVQILSRYIHQKRSSGRSDLELRAKLGRLERKLSDSPNAPVAWLSKVFQETQSRALTHPASSSSSSSSSFRPSGENHFGPGIAGGKISWKSPLSLSLNLPGRRSSADSSSSSASPSSSAANSIRRWAEEREWDEVPPAYTR